MIMDLKEKRVKSIQLREKSNCDVERTVEEEKVGLNSNDWLCAHW